MKSRTRKPTFGSQIVLTAVKAHGPFHAPIMTPQGMIQQAEGLYLQRVRGVAGGQAALAVALAVGGEKAPTEVHRCPPVFAAL